MTAEELASLTPAERSELRLMLSTMNAAESRLGARRRRMFLIGCAVALPVLAVWTVALGLTLPRQQTVGSWRMVWVGFDVGLLLTSSVTAWAAWRGRQLLIPAAIVTGTLLLCDAWFDVVLSWGTGERWQSVASAIVIEIPLAITLWWAARALVIRSIRMARSRIGLTGPAPGLHALLLFVALARPES